MPPHGWLLPTADGKDIGTVWSDKAIGMTLTLRGPMAATSHAEAYANAAFIVRAVNNHERLVEALEEIIANPPCSDPDCCARARANTIATDKARAALEAAKEGA